MISGRWTVVSRGGIASILVKKEFYCSFEETQWREGEINKEFTQIKNHQEKRDSGSKKDI